MAGPNGASIRQPAVAGMFYPSDSAQCRQQAEYCVRLPVALQGQGIVRGAIVPHAGWVFSGAIAGQAIGAAARSRPEAGVIVVFGAVHTPLPLSVAAFDTHDAWQEPGAMSAVSSELRGRLASDARWFCVDDRFHQREHAVEVLLPMIQAAWPNAQVLPVEVPAIDNAMEIGRATAKAAVAAGLNPVYLASSDLTHYGPNYRFAPAGIGPVGLAWAKENDRRLLAAVMAMLPERIMPEVRARQNACGPGAIAAMMAACMEHGAKLATVISHANSFETGAAVGRQTPDNAVGYAAVVIH
ncbi:MAG: AmmeMemoRadiSam system protein B [Tepidisphaeraceae bacterium]|jgi:AmmeMemoRadiSam system protein B